MAKRSHEMRVTVPGTKPQAEASAPAARRLTLSVKLSVALAACSLILALAAFGTIAWRGMGHLEPIDRHLQALTHLQQTALGLEELAIEDLNAGAAPQARLDTLRQAITKAIASDNFISPGTTQRLATIENKLADLGPRPEAAMTGAIEQLRHVLAAELLAQGELVARVRHDLALEFGITGLTVLVLASLGAYTLVRIRRRVVTPLINLEHLLSLLAKRDYALAPTEGVDPLVHPLTTSYNHLVNRLVELEAESARHRDTLEQEVRTVTEALMEQHRSLSAAERLAATGEVAARIAHELRNPLAGMQIALSNIRTECSDRGEVVERLDLVIDELRRVTGLLNGLLDQSRISPEPAVDLPLDKTVGELMSIVRYQISKDIWLRKIIPEDLVCHLPRDRMRQVLLNLILNAADAIGDRGGEILVRAVLVDDKLELSVADNGPGFPDGLLSEGIGPFRRGRPDGIGLGLSVVSRLVGNLDGRMELRNLEPHGACVQLTLPCRGPNA
jgi:signal transduction histidine kinase